MIFSGVGCVALGNGAFMPSGGRILDADGSVVNLVDVLGGGAPVSSSVYSVGTFAPMSGLIVGEDGRAYSVVELLRNFASGVFDGLGVSIVHNLGAFPNVVVLEGEGDPFVVSHLRKLSCSVEYLDRNSVVIFTEKHFGPVDSIVFTDKYEHVITFADSALFLRVLFFVNGGDDFWDQTGNSYFYINLY